jgi:hypothetical protein
MLTALKKERKAKKEEKLRVCDFCGQKENLVSCSGFCKSQFHLLCLQAFVSKMKPDLAAKCVEGDNSVVDKNSMCLFCQSGQAICFVCRKESPLTQNVFPQASVGTSTDKSVVFRCTICPKFYHPGCMKPTPKPVLAPKDTEPREEKQPEAEPTEFQCEQHFCTTCGVFSRTIYQCVECPFASHRKCMSKRNQILGGHKMLCVKHIVKVERPPKVDKKLVKQKSTPQEPKPTPQKKSKEAKEVKEPPKAEKKPDRKPSAAPEKPKERPRERSKEARQLSKPTNSPHKDDAQLGKRVKMTSLEKKERPTKAEKPSKKLKTSAESNQKLAFNLYQPFDYSSYRKVT